MATSMNWDPQPVVFETTRLNLKTRTRSNELIEQHFATLYPELNILDPQVGKMEMPLFFSIYTKPIDKEMHIGACCLYNLENTEVELGIRIFMPDYWSVGYGTEAVNALCDYAFRTFAITSVVLKTPKYNTRAIRCYQKSKFVIEKAAIMDGYEMIIMRRGRNT